MDQLSGYDTEFVDPPLELQYDCSICLSILRDPYLVHCCGMSYCYKCIQPIVEIRKPQCPLCKGNPNPTAPDKRLSRQLRERNVYCLNRKHGCEWIGPLADFDNHLNLNPTSKDRLKGCSFVPIKCLYCENLHNRSKLEQHEDTCPQKPYACEYCREFTGTKYILTNQHYGVCDHYPVKCTNDCGETFPRFKLNSHLINDCSLTTVNCDFHYAGCDAWLMRRDLPNHLVTQARKHASLLSDENTKLMIENDRLRAELNSTVSDCADFTEENEILKKERDRLQMKTLSDECETIHLTEVLEAKDAELNQTEQRLKTEAEALVRSRTECKQKDTQLKVRDTLTKDLKERAMKLEAELDKSILDSTKKESLLDEIERKNTSLQSELVEGKKQLQDLGEELEALKKKREVELASLQQELENKTRIISEQEKRLKNSLKKSPQDSFSMERWLEFDPYGREGSPAQGASASGFQPYTTYHEQRVANSSQSVEVPPMPVNTQPMETNKTAVPFGAWQQPPMRSAIVPTTVSPVNSQQEGVATTTPVQNAWQQPLPPSVHSTNKTPPPSAMNFSSAVKRSPSTKSTAAAPNTPPGRVRTPSNSKNYPSTPNKQCKLMIRNTPSKNRGITDQEIIKLFSRFGHVYSIDRNGSNTAVVYDNMESVTKGIVESDNRKLVCGGIVLNCTYEKK